MRGTLNPKDEQNKEPQRLLLGRYDQGVSTFIPISADLSEASATTINQLRQAISVQQYYEALARGGSRYREQVQAIWDVIISDKPYKCLNIWAVDAITSTLTKSCRPVASKQTTTRQLVKRVQCQSHLSTKVLSQRALKNTAL